MSNIKWETPPSAHTGNRKRKRTFFGPSIKRQLKDRPGEWAMVHKGISTYHIGNAKKSNPDFEFMTRAIKGKASHIRKVYARYNPKVES